MADRNRTSFVISALIGCTAALVTYIVFFYFIYQPGQPVDMQPMQSPVLNPAATPSQEIPNPEINVANVSSVRIRTTYKGYFEADNKCSKSYNEYFGNNDGFASPSSPCTIKLAFNRDGDATRSIEIERWDKTTKQKELIEKSDSTTDVTPEQFDALAHAIVTNDAFRSWREGTMITVSNCAITVTYPGGSKTPMSNVNESASTYLQMVDAFKRLEKQLRWK